MKLGQTIQMLLKDYEPFHSEFQIKNFIVGSAGNAWMQYKQCLREIKARYDAILEQKDNIRLLELDLKQLKNKIFIRRKIFQRAKNEIETARRVRKLESAKIRLVHTIRELQTFAYAALLIREKAGFNGLSPEKKSQLEALAWLEKAKKMAALDLIAFGGFSRPTVDFIFSLPAKYQRELLTYLKKENHSRLIEWAIN